MLISLIYNSPVWSNLDTTSRVLRIIAVGLVCYIAIHSYLHSTYVDNNELILKYRSYLIYLAGVDLLGVLALYYTSKPRKTKKKKISKRSTKAQLIHDAISPDIKMKIQQKIEPTKPMPAKPNDDKHTDPFVTQDEITTNSIPIYKSKRKETDSIPVYHHTKNTIIS